MGHSMRFQSMEILMLLSITNPMWRKTLSQERHIYRLVKNSRMWQYTSNFKSKDLQEIRSWYCGWTLTLRFLPQRSSYSTPCPTPAFVNAGTSGTVSSKPSMPVYRKAWKVYESPLEVGLATHKAWTLLSLSLNPVGLWRDKDKISICGITSWFTMNQLPHRKLLPVPSIWCNPIDTGQEC